MLRGIRKASTTWLGRIVLGAVMGLLAAIFALWGINDIFSGFGRSTLAKIGHTEISVEQFRSTYNERLRQVERQLGHPLPPEQVKAIGLDRQVLSTMVAEAGLDQRAQQMRLGLSDAEIVRRITTEKAFLGPTGRFDRAQFEQLLRQAGYSEQRFISEQRRVTLRQQLIGSLSGDLPVPKAWLDAVNQFQNEERSIEYVALGPAQAGDIPLPTPEELNKYFEVRKILFRAPEYRKIVVVSETPAEMARWMEISEADIKAAYDQNRSRFVKPERRRVEQIIFPNMAEAEAAEAHLKSGLSFAALAAERGLKEQDYDLGTVTKADIIDPAVADAAFALKEGDVSAPVQGRFGVVIVTVLKVESEENKTLAELAPKIRSDLAAERAKREVRDLHDKIEDERAGGASLEQVAQKLKLTAATYDVDHSGLGTDGKPVSSLPHAAQVISAAFNSDIGVDNDPIDADGGFIWYSVTGITPARDRTLDEVKSEVEAHWRDDQIASRLSGKAAGILDKVKAGTPLEEVAKAEGLKVETADKLKRQVGSTTVPAKIIVSVFHTAKGSFGSSEGAAPSQWIVFRVTDVTDPKPDATSADAKNIEDLIKRQVSEDIFGQYVSSVEDDLGTTVNPAALERALGNSTPETN
jgi:peptidyl-prolyl cis-trans isomerase D